MANASDMKTSTRLSDALRRERAVIVAAQAEYEAHLEALSLDERFDAEDQSGDDIEAYRKNYGAALSASMLKSKQARERLHEAVAALSSERPA